MKKIQNKFRMKLNALIAAVLGMLGATSCTDYNHLLPAYGVVNPVDYCYIDIDGAVTDEQGEPLQAVQVVIKTARAGYLASAFTNKAGEFHCNGGGLSDRGADTLQVTSTDTSNVYLSNSIKIPFTDMEVESMDERGGQIYYSVDIKVQMKKR